MNILFITHYSALYGANKSMLNLLDGLADFKINSLVVVPEYGGVCERLEKKDIPYVIQKFHWWCGIIPENNKYKIKGFYKKLQKRRNLERVNKESLSSLKEKTLYFNPDLIYSNSSVFNFGFLFSRQLNVPHFWHIREVQKHYGFEWYYDKRTIKKNFKNSEIVMAISEFVKKKYKEDYKIMNILVEKDSVLSYDDLLLLDKRRKQKSQINNTSVTFGLIGLIHPNKGQEEAIKAFSIVNKIYQSTTLLIAGAGDQFYLRELVNRLKIEEDKVQFLGHLSNPFEAFLKMDVCLMCSRLEGLGRVSIEAMAAGVPVIGYKEGGTIEVIEENKNGLFYENGFYELANKMIYMIENKKHRLEMGGSGRQIFEQKYTTEIYAKNFMKILDNNNIS